MNRHQKNLSNCLKLLDHYISVVFPVAYIAPWSAGHEIVRVGLRHQFFEQALKSVSLGFEEGKAKILFITDLLVAIHAVQGQERLNVFRLNLMVSSDPNVGVHD